MSNSDKKNGKGEQRGGVRRETMIAIAVASLFVGYLAGSLTNNVSSGMASGPTVASQAVPGELAFIDELRKKTEENPENADAWTDLGNAYFDTGMHENAIAAYTRSLKLAPGNPDVLTDLGIMYRRTGNPARAVESFDKAIAASPGHLMSKFNKGIVLLHDLRDEAGTIEAWQDLVRIAPQFRSPTGELVIDLLKGLQAQ